MMLMEEIEDNTNRRKDILCPWIGRINIVKMTTLPMQSTDLMQSLSWDSPGENTGVVCHAQGIFPTQGSNPRLLHYREILHCSATGEAQSMYA